MAVVVARIGKAHGLRGEVTVQVHTDAPDERFVVGTVFETDPASAGPLTLTSARHHRDVLLLGFAEAADRTGAEALRGTRLLAPEDRDATDAWYEEDLLGLPVVDPRGVSLGTVSGLESRPHQDLLLLRLADGREAAIPFVHELVPEVDLTAGRIVADPPPGLLDLDRG